LLGLVVCLSWQVVKTTLFIGRPYVKRFALWCRTVVLSVCLSYLSVTLVYCGETVGCVKIKLGMQVGLGPGHIVSDGDRKGHNPPIFGLYLLWPNGWMDQDATWSGGRPRPSNIVLDENPAPPYPKREQRPQFSALFLLWLNDWMHRDATSYGCRLRSMRHCARWRCSSSPKRGTAPIFGPYLLWRNGWMDQDAT